MKIIKLFFAVFLLCFIASAFATQTLTAGSIPSLAGNPQTISWTYSDSTNNQDQNVCLYYSGSVGQRNNLITCKDLSDCGYGTEYFWEDVNSFDFSGSSAIVNFNNQLLIFTSNGTTADIRFLDPITNTFSNASDFYNGLDLNAPNASSFALFVYNSNLYFRIGCGGGGYCFPDGQSYRYDSILKQWFPDTNFTFPFGSATNNLDSSWLKFFNYNSNLRVFRVFDSSIPDYNSATLTSGLWIKDNAVVSNYKATVGFLAGTFNTIFERNNSLYSIYAGAVAGSLRIFKYFINNWSDVSADYNGGYSITNVSYFSSATLNSTTYFLVNYNNLANHKILKQTDSPRTSYSSQKTCSYSWDFSNVDAGYYYIDANIRNGLGTSVQASTNQFIILPAGFTNPTFEITPIQNISSTSLLPLGSDANIYATAGDVIYKVKHITYGSDTLNHHIFLNNRDNKQYWIYSINCGATNNCSNYTNGNWTFNSSLTYGSSAAYDDPMQKIWNNSANAYDYSFSDSGTGLNTYVYYKLTYRFPIRYWTYLTDNTQWHQQYPATEEPAINGESYSVWATSYANNINSYLIQPIPDINANTDASYEFQFTGYADGPITLYIGDENAAINCSAMKCVSLTTTPHRYSVDISDVNNLAIKTNTVVANRVFLAVPALADRGYFKTRLKLMQENGEDLPVWVTASTESTITAAVTDANSYVLPNSFSLPWNTDSLGQTFLAPALATSISTIRLKLVRSSDWNGFISVNLFDGNFLQSLGTKGLNESSIPTSSGWVDFTFTTPVTIQAGKTYGFSIHVGTTNGTSIAVEEDNQNIYTDGNQAAIHFSPSPKIITYVPNDFGFEAVFNSGGTSYQYIDEWNPFKFSADAYDREQRITHYKVAAYANAYADQNRILYLQKDFNSPTTEYFFTFQDTIQGITLLTEGLYVLTPIKITVSLCDDSYCFEEISSWTKLRNYPYLSNDPMIQVREETRKPNNPPKGEVILRALNPKAITKLVMFIYQGKKTCYPYNAGTSSICNSDNTATGIEAGTGDLAFKKEFYNGIDFTCTSNGVCDFRYDLRNYWHFPSEGDYTTFMQVLFNTTLDTTYSSRTIFTIGKQNLSMHLEFQGLGPENYYDQNCLNNVAGIFRSEFIYSPQSQALNKLLCPQSFPNNILCQLYLLGKTTQQLAQEAYAALMDGRIPENEYKNIIGNFGCKIVIPSSQSVKLVAKVYTQQLEDFHKYALASFYIEDSNGFPVSLSYYPTDIFYNIDDGSNIFVWNTNLYDNNGHWLWNGQDYNAVVTVEDLSMQNKTTTKEISISIDNSRLPVLPQTIDFLPINFFAMDLSNNLLAIETYVRTRQKHIDKIEFTLFTENSSFDNLKSDRENQKITFLVDAEDLIRLEEKGKFDANRVYQEFIGKYVDADIVGACITGGVIGGASLGVLAAVAIGTGLVATGVGAPVGFAIAGVALAGGMAGCGTGGIMAWAAGDMHNSTINAQLATDLNTLNYERYRAIPIQLQNFAINDYDELRSQLRDANTTSRETVINDLAKEGKKSTLSPITINVMGKSYTAENTLVGDGSLIENARNHNARLKINIFYNYNRSNAIKIYDLFDVQPVKKQGDYLGDANNAALEFIQKYPFLLLLIVVAIIAIAYVRIIIFGRGR